jgi:hypothetical protein
LGPYRQHLDLHIVPLIGAVKHPANSGRPSFAPLRFVGTSGRNTG